MIFKRTFNLNTEEGTTKSTEKLYQPKRLRWCKCIVIPLLIAFVLLLILMNVDFTGKAYNKTSLEENVDSVLVMGRSLMSEIKISSRGLLCVHSADQCAIACQSGNINNINKELEPLSSQCPHDIELYLYECIFPAGKMKADFLKGNFRLRTLAIVDCNLASIEDAAFQQDSVANLKILDFINTKFVSLGKESFKGLTALEDMYIKNDISWTAFKGQAFLESLKNNLKEFRFTQKLKDGTSSDPYEWFHSSNMPYLRKVDLSDNNFSQLLAEQTFASFYHVETLILKNCSLNQLPTNIFDSMLKTLEFLDLSGNQFMNLDAMLLVKLNEVPQLFIAANNWDCECKNEKMFNVFKELQPNIDDWKNARCATPLELWNVNIFDVDLECDESLLTLDASTGTSEATSDATSDATSEATSDAASEVTSAATTTAIATPTTTNTTIPTVEVNNTTLDIETSTESNWTTASGSTSIRTTNGLEVNTGTTEIDETEETEGTTDITYTTMPYSTTSFSTTDTTTTFPTTRPTIPTTLEYSTSTPFYPTETTPPTPKPPIMTINCKNPNNSTKTVVIFEPHIQFNISHKSETSVQISLSQPQINFDIIYFDNYRNYLQNLHQSFQNRASYMLVVNDLKPDTSYVFCLIPINYKENLSPFDCKSIYLYVDEMKAWLLNKDQCWIVALVVLGACLFVLIGLLVIYCVIRMKVRRKCVREPLRRATFEEGNAGESNTNNINVRQVETPLSDLRLYTSVVYHPSGDKGIGQQTAAQENSNQPGYYLELEEE